ncbi:MAG: hypothetical protein HY896_01950 [Deltaproteobacteria bacterium]|nr:hypothetical protein [Deltaproteobacteria bacterium]
MKRIAAIVLAGVSCLVAIFMTAGCTQSRQAGRAEPPPEISVRFPAKDPPDVSLKAEEQRNTPGDPTVLTDDTKRPWLKVIEVEVTPKESEKPVEQGEATQ